MKRKIAIGLAVVLALTFAARLAVSGVASSRFAAYDARWKTEVAAERARTAALVRPVVEGTPVEADAAPRYAKLASIEDLRQAVRCTRCDWRIPYETALEEPLPDYVALEKLAARLVAEGDAHALEGDLAGAGDRDLDAARFGADLEASGLVGAAAGMRIESLALAALEKLVAGPPSLDRARIAAAVARLDAARPSPALLVRQLRLGFRSIATEAQARETKGTEDERAGVILVPPLATSELAAIELDELGVALEKAVALDPAARKESLDLILQKVNASWNPETRLWGAGITSVREPWDACHAAYAAVASAATR
jgi:hypothetical protein